MPRIRAIFACTRCGLMYVGVGYNLEWLFGKPRFCDECEEVLGINL